MSDGWIVNTGGCPVAKGTRVDVIYRDGKKLYDLPANENYPLPRDANNAFWNLEGDNNDIIMWRLHKQETQPNTQPVQVFSGMTAAQLNIYTKNFLTLTEGLQSVGGNAGAFLRKHVDFLETLARNGLEIHSNI